MKKIILLLVTAFFSLYFIVFSVSYFTNDELSTTAHADMPEILPDTKHLTWQGDLSKRMMDGAHRCIERKIDESVKDRQKYWNRDFTSRTAYEGSIEPNSNVWGLLHGFGDAEIATLIAPRPLVIEYSSVPEVSSHKGDLHTPAYDDVFT